MGWLKDISQIPPSELVCTHPEKNPSSEKIADYCRTTRDGKGCPNLLPKALIENKPEEVEKIGYLRKRRK